LEPFIGLIGLKLQVSDLFLEIYSLCYSIKE